MDPGILEKVKRLLQRVNVVYVSTANKEGIPHVAVEKGMVLLEKDQVFFRAWFCLTTLDNLRENPIVSLAVLDPKTNRGFQLLGETEEIEKKAILNGFAPAKEKEWAGYPQAEYQLLIRIRKISHLATGPHSDEFLNGSR
jgi:general stress protein 26